MDFFRRDIGEKDKHKHTFQIYTCKGQGHQCVIVLLPFCSMCFCFSLSYNIPIKLGKFNIKHIYQIISIEAGEKERTLLTHAVYTLMLHHEIIYPDIDYRAVTPHIDQAL